MLRNEIQNKTGLTRKAIEYYEEKGLINPQKTENGYRDYSENDLEVLIQISLFRKLGISVTEIEGYLTTGISALSSVLRRKQHQLDVEEKRKEVLELVVKGENQELINEKIKLIEAEESIYERLERLFPGYFGQMLFAAYQPFLNESLGKDEEEAFEKYVDYLDNLPLFQLSKDEQNYIEKISSTFDMQILKKVNKDKINAIENVEKWLKENDNTISQYEEYKNSEEYQKSLMKEIAIPLIRKFSKSYDDYYKKLIVANDKYLEIKC